MTTETNPESSPSLAGGFFDPEFQRECCDAEEKELTSRAMAAAAALLDEYGIKPCGTYREEWELEPASLEGIAAVIKPFLKPKPTTP